MSKRIYAKSKLLRASTILAGVVALSLPAHALKISADAVEDTSGNGNAEFSLSILDGILPALDTTNAAYYMPTEYVADTTALTVVIAFDEKVSLVNGVNAITSTNTDVAIGDLTAVAGDTTSMLFQATITPEASASSEILSGNIPLSLAAGAVTDDNSNLNAAVADLATISDKNVPVAVLDGPAEYLPDVAFNLTVMFSEEVTGLTADDFAITSGGVTIGTAGAPTLVNGSYPLVYTVPITPNFDASGDMEITLAANAVTDEAGNALAADVLLSTTDPDGTGLIELGDAVGPTVINYTPVDGTSYSDTSEIQVTLTFDEQLDVTTFTSTDFELDLGTSSGFTVSTDPSSADGGTTWTVGITPVGSGPISLFIPAQDQPLPKTAEK